MDGWWYRNIVEPGKLPLLLALLAFVVTFAVTRFVTRMIRAGRGPFHDVTSSGGHHVHHMVPGVVLMCVGGFGGAALGGRGWAASLAAVVFGIGTGLVLDEFALILYLQDVYWTDQGRKSVEMVVVTVAMLTVLLVGFAPLGVNNVGTSERAGRADLIATMVGNFLLVLVCLFKGKHMTAVFGVLVPFLALVGAMRLARPGSLWATRLYRRRPRAAVRAQQRFLRHDARWGAVRRKVDNIVGGTPSDQQ